MKNKNRQSKFAATNPFISRQFSPPITQDLYQRLIIREQASPNLINHGLIEQTNLQQDLIEQKNIQQPHETEQTNIEQVARITESLMGSRQSNVDNEVEYQTNEIENRHFHEQPNMNMESTTGIDNPIVFENQSNNELKPAIILGPDDPPPSGLEIIRRRPSIKKTENQSFNPLDDFSDERYDSKKEAFLAGYIAGMNASSQNTFKRRY